MRTPRLAVTGGALPALRRCATALGIAAALGGCAEDVPPNAPPRNDAGAWPDQGPVEDPCVSGLVRELAADARREGDAFVLTYDNSARAVQGALLAPCATAEHVTVWRHVMTREARLEVVVESADPMETVAWVLDRCEPVLAEPLACAPSAPVSGARRAQTRTVTILRAGAEVFVAVGGARRPPREGEGPRDARGSFTLRVEERAPLAAGEVCGREVGVADCAADASCQRRTAFEEVFACTRDGVRNGRCRVVGAPCEEGLRCEEERCQGPVPEGSACGPTDRFACAKGSRCVDLNGAYRCVVDGARDGGCRPVGVPCDEGFRCNTDPARFDARCFPALADGEACSDENVLCLEGSTCVADGSVPGAPPVRCVRDGAVAGACRATDPPCDSGLACNGVPGTGAGAQCRSARQVGEACGGAPVFGACVAPARCLAEGSGWVCRAPPYGAVTIVPGSALDACERGVPLSFDGEASRTSQSVALPFAVRFFGRAYERVWPSRRGYVVFGGRAPRETLADSIPIPGEGPMFAPFLADLTLAPGARLCAWVDRDVQRLMLSWRGFSLARRAGSRVDVSAAITVDGVIEFQYQALQLGDGPLLPDVAPRMTAGLQAEGDALYLIARVPAVGNGLRFTPR